MIVNWSHYDLFVFHDDLISILWSEFVHFMIYLKNDQSTQNPIGKVHSTMVTWCKCTVTVIRSKIVRSKHSKVIRSIIMVGFVYYLLLYFPYNTIISNHRIQYPFGVILSALLAVYLGYFCFIEIVKFRPYFPLCVFEPNKVIFCSEANSLFWYLEFCVLWHWVI